MGRSVQFTKRHLRTRSRTFDAVVVGAGLHGCACALELQRLGFKVLCVDKESSPGRGITSRSPGMVSCLLQDREACRMARESYYCWEAWRDYLRAERSDELISLGRVGSCSLIFEGSGCESD